MQKPIPLSKRAILCCLVIIVYVPSFSQTKWFSGVVTQSNGNPVPFATLTVKEKEDATVAEADGSFIIKAASTDSIIINAVGFNAGAFALKNENKALYALSSNANTLPAVVVTSAFDTKKEKQMAPYSAQLIPSETINIIPQTNLNDALVGKIAGVQFRGQSGAKLNSQAFARVRGGIILSGDAAPTFVVDGTIVLDANSIDPSTIENITVLKGANATAIFGGFANGAIIITTKKAKLNTSSIQFNQGLTFDKVGKMPAFQNTYAGGNR